MFMRRATVNVLIYIFIIINVASSMRIFMSLLGRRTSSVSVAGEKKIGGSVRGIVHVESHSTDKKLKAPSSQTTTEPRQGEAKSTKSSVKNSIAQSSRDLQLGSFEHRPTANWATVVTAVVTPPKPRENDSDAKRTKERRPAKPAPVPAPPGAVVVQPDRQSQQPKQQPHETETKPTNPNRKGHKNKYASFSKNIEELDPIEETIKRNQAEEEHLRLQTAAPSRGTTVPMSSGSEKMKIKTKQQQMNATFENVSSVIPSDPITFGYVQVGYIGSPHGVKGELKVQMETDFAVERLQPGSVLYVKRPHRRTPRPIIVELGRKQNGDTYLVKFQHVNTRLTAAAFREFSLYVRKEDRPELQSDEYLVRDLVEVPVYVEIRGPSEDDLDYGGVHNRGVEGGVDRQSVVPTQLRYIGVVSGVVPPDELCDPSLAALMHAMLEIKLDRKGRSVETDDPDGPGDTMCLIPLVPSIVTSVVLKDGERRIVINPPEGLLDLTYSVKKKVLAIRGFLPAKSAYLTKADREALTRVCILQFPER